MVKAGHQEVFPLLGYSDSIELATPTLQLSKDLVQLGGSLEFQLNLKSAASCHQKMVVDFAIHFVKANGERKPKVFKLKSIALAPEESCQLVKAHAIKAITTRKYYLGIQLLEILVNGKSLISREFTLITAWSQIAKIELNIVKSYENVIFTPFSSQPKYTTLCQ